MWLLPLHLPVVQLVCVRRCSDCRCDKTICYRVRSVWLIAALTRDKCNSIVSDAADRFLDLPDAAPSCSGQVKLLVRAKAKTRRSLWQIPCHNVTPAITPARHPHLLQICRKLNKTTVFAGGQRQNVLAGGSKQRANKYVVFPESFSESPLKLNVFLFRAINEWQCHCSLGKENNDQYWYMLTNDNNPIWDLARIYPFTFCFIKWYFALQWQQSSTSPLKDQLWRCGSLLFPVRLVDAGDLGY